MPLQVQYVSVLPVGQTRTFFSIDKPNVEIVTVKTLAQGAVYGEVTSAPLAPKVNKDFVIRLQEFSGKATDVTISVPAKVRSASLMNITESVELRKLSELSPLKVSLKPFECATVRIEIE